MNYEEDMRIDETALDVEWLGQSSLMLKYVKHSAFAKSELSCTKERLSIYKAEIASKIRSNPEAFIPGKITEAAILDVIVQDKRYQELCEEMRAADYEFDIASGVIKAITQRKEALENLVKLHGQGYFAGPSVRRDLSKEWEERERQKQANAKVGGLKRKGKKG